MLLNFIVNESFEHILHVIPIFTMVKKSEIKLLVACKYANEAKFKQWRRPRDGDKAYTMSTNRQNAFHFQDTE